MRLWIGNIAPDTSDEEIRAFLAKYTRDLKCTAIQRVEGDGSRPAAVLEIANADSGALEAVSIRLNGIVWKDRELLVQVPMR